MTTFHPTFLYELLWNIGVALAVIAADRRWRLGHGRAFALYLALYAVGRTWIEALRIDEANTFFGVRLNVFVMGAVLTGSVLYLVLRRRSGREDVVEQRPPDETAPGSGDVDDDSDETDRDETDRDDRPRRDPTRKTGTPLRVAGLRPGHGTGMTTDQGTGTRGAAEPTGSTPGEHHHEHRDVTGGWLRPAVFGIMDGLVSNTALIAGVAGGGVSSTTVVLTGLAGLAAGAFSMATGEYVSVASQSELTQAEIAIEKAEIARVPEAEEAELAAIFHGRGVDLETAREVARQLSVDPEQAWRVHAREELGVDPDDLPSPWLAAGSSFVAFSLGALVPRAALPARARQPARGGAPRRGGAVRRRRRGLALHQPRRRLLRRTPAAARCRSGGSDLRDRLARSAPGSSGDR